MRDRKSYGQFCGLARAMDHVGDRWTLLVVRELLLGPARYGELSAALPGLATNLLATRLRQLADDGIVQRAGVAYRLTPHGRGLEKVILELIRWGAVYMTDGPADDVVDERWAWLALRALLEGATPVLPRGEVAVRCGGSDFAVVVGEDGRRVLPGVPSRPAATLAGPLPALLAAVSLGEWSDDIGIDGDAAYARAVMTSAEPAGRPGPR